LASGIVSHHRAIRSASVLASSCQAGDSGWAPGDGHPIRSHEQERPPEKDLPTGEERCIRPGANAPGQTGQPIAAYRMAASAILFAVLRPRPRSTASTNQLHSCPNPESIASIMHGVAVARSPAPAGETYPMHNGDCKVTVATLLAVDTAPRSGPADSRCGTGRDHSATKAVLDVVAVRRSRQHRRDVGVAEVVSLE